MASIGKYEHWAINCDPRRFDEQVEENHRFAIIAKDKRTKLAFAIEEDCPLDTIMCNYIDLHNEKRNEFRSRIVQGNKMIMFSYLELGLIPVFFMPLEVFSFEQVLQSNVAAILNKNNIKSYTVPSYDFFKGYTIRDNIHTDIWARRRDIASLVGKSEETVSAKDFIKLLFEEGINESV